MIVITTPTGTLGSRILRQLILSDQRLRVVARYPEKIPQPFRDCIEVIEGSLEDEKFLTRALSDARALFWCQPDPVSSPDYFEAYRGLARNLKSALEISSVGHVVAISAAGGNAITGAGTISALHEMELILSEASPSFRFLRCGAFFENLFWQRQTIIQDGSFSYPVRADAQIPQVAADDIANLASALLLGQKWTGKETVTLAGPRDTSYREVAEILSLETGKSIEFRTIDRSEFERGLISQGWSMDAAKRLADMFDYLDNRYESDAFIDRSLTPTELSDWVKTSWT